jgi:Secretion system C-terminal sorting domain
MIIFRKINRNMKKIITTIVATMLAIATYAQPNITKSIVVKDMKCNNEIIGFDLHETMEYGNKIYGVGQVYNGTSTYPDAILMVMNQNYDTLNTIRYGGSRDDNLRFINRLPNGNLLLTGETNSKNGSLLGYAHTYAAREIWFMEVDTNGIIIKMKTLSGSGDQSGCRPLISSDGYIYTGGSTSAKDYDFTHLSNFGIFDYDPFYCKLDTNFNIKWMKIITTLTPNDAVHSITEVNANKILVNILVDDTLLPEFVNTNQKGQRDFVMFCIDSNNNEYWKNRYGGTRINVISKMFYDSIINKVICAGFSSSADGDIGYHTGQNENLNIWVMILDTFGNILASKAYGSVKESCDAYASFAYYHHQLWVSGRYVNANGDFTNNTIPLNDTIYDNWFGIIDTNANLIAKMVLKTDIDFNIGNFDIHFNGLWYNGWENYNNFSTLSCNTSKLFFFAINLEESPLGIINKIKTVFNIFEIYPNPTQADITINLSQTNKYKVSVYDKNGKQVYNATINKAITISTISWASGQYYVTVGNDAGQQTLSFIKQ